MKWKKRSSYTSPHPCYYTLVSDVSSGSIRRNGNQWRLFLEGKLISDFQYLSDAKSYTPTQ